MAVGLNNWTKDSVKVEAKVLFFVLLNDKKNEFYTWVYFFCKFLIMKFFVCNKNIWVSHGCLLMFRIIT